MERIIWPTVKGMAAEGNTYTVFLYAGLMIDKQGNPKVIEFNCRFGDPETQPIMLRMKSDLLSSAWRPVKANWTRKRQSGMNVLLSAW
uniref:hypothetical protein n=1 Tax=Shigella flexneri TaxID=623 RepID=UPI00223C8305|nr:hypothetical protein [Shigella flexneri]